MTLASRLCLFFLGAIGVVLVGFSVTLYLLARNEFHHQVDARLQSALETLSTAAEVKLEGVQWEGHERPMTLGQEPGAEQVRWQVCDGQGKPVDRSRNFAVETFPLWPTNAEPGSQTEQVQSAQGQSWRLVQRRLQAGRLDPSKEYPPEPPDTDPKYDTLVLTAGLSLEPMETTLRNLALVLAGLSVGLWLVAALLGRSLCQRALLPLTQMADAADSIHAANLDLRVPAAPTGDELERLGRAFNNLLARLEDSFERQRRFTGDASHQLRTPLTAILGHLDVILRRDRSPEDYRDVLTLVRGESAHLLQLVEMLLFLARADAESRTPHGDMLDLTLWLNEHQRSWTGHARGADVRVEGTANGPLWVKVQAPLLGQLVDNLLDNACKYSEPGTPITLRLGKEAGSVFLAVEDMGCGIPAEDLPHLFEPFYRSAQVRSRGVSGIGLGLAVARRIATAFGGDLRAQNRKEQGSCFVISIPEANGSDSQSQAQVKSS